MKQQQIIQAVEAKYIPLTRNEAEKHIQNLFKGNAHVEIDKECIASIIFDIKKGESLKTRRLIDKIAVIESATNKKMFYWQVVSFEMEGSFKDDYEHIVEMKG